MEKVYLHAKDVNCFEVKKYSKSEEVIEVVNITTNYNRIFIEELHIWIKENIGNYDFKDLDELPKQIVGVEKSVAFFYIWDKFTTSITRYEDIYVYREDDGSYNVYKDGKYGLMKIKDCLDAKKEALEYLEGYFQKNKIRAII